uniref:MARVEL domain-containing protein n=1 Tax=Arundo donax TaxID=35708 RepID=A0A0A9AJG8_ARUDO
MALSSPQRIALIVAFFGLLAFVLGVIAENKKPPYGTPIQGKDVVLCKFPNDPTIAMGSLSLVALVLTAIVGHVAIFHPYSGKSVPRGALFQSTSLSVFFVVAELVSALAFAMLIWATVTEGLHRTNNIHHDMDYQCPTAKTGLFGGAAFLSLDAALFWLVCQMLALNTRADYLDEDDNKGEYGQVYAAEVDGSKV